MLPAQVTALLGADDETGPVGLDTALALVGAFDEGLVQGFARIGEARAGALVDLAGALSGTPLGDRIAEAVDKTIAGSVGDEHLLVLAAARAALLGAVHDALLARVDAATHRTRTVWQPPTGAVGPADQRLVGVRAWLRELAITGWRGVDHDLVAASAPLVSALLAEPSLRRIAVLLDGFAAELRSCCPVATMPQVPVRRWADLWVRAVLLCEIGAYSTDGAPTVSGRLLPLGVDVHEHPTAVQMQVHAVFEPTGGGAPQLVRASVGAAKVDTIVGPAVWHLLGGFPTLMGALAGRRVLELSEMPLTADGDLIWAEQRAALAEPADPFATARVRLGDVVAPPVAALDRHPVRIAEPVLLEGYTVGGEPTAMILDGVRIAVDLDRLPACGPLTPAAVSASSACIGLLRWDAGRWSVQPLALQSVVKRAAVTTCTADWAQGPVATKGVKVDLKAGDTVAVLRERAGRLLRK